MNRLIKEFIKKCLTIILSPLKLIVPMGDVILIQTLTPFRYCENSAYLYEYLSENTDLNVYWVTSSDQVISMLSEKKYKYLDRRNFIQMIILTLRAKMVIDSGMEYYNFLNLLNSNAIKLCISHGCGLKCVMNESEVYRINRFDFMNFPSEWTKEVVAKHHYKIPEEKIKLFGFARCEQFFDKQFVEKAYKVKDLAKKMNPSFKNDGRILLFTPTWRTYEYQFPFLEDPEFSWEDFDKFLEEENLYFYYTLHSAAEPTYRPEDTQRITYVDTDKFWYFDINKFMMEADILINDYSTTTTDFTLLKRPQIHFMPDFEQYLLVKGFIEDYKKAMPGPEAKSMNEMKQIIVSYLNNPDQYLNEYSDKIDEYLDKYYDQSLNSPCRDISEFIKQLINT